MRTLAVAILLCLCSCAAPRQDAEAARPIVVEVECPNVTDDVLMSAVTVSLETRLSGMDGMKRLRSLSQHGRCLIRLDLKDGADVDAVRKNVEARLADFKSLEPEWCDPKVTLLVPPAGDSFAVVALTAAAERDPRELAALARDALRNRLPRIAGIAAVHMRGADEESWEVLLDPAKLAARELTAADVISAVRKVAGQPQQDGNALREAVIVVREGGPVRVRDVASVQRSTRSTEVTGFARRKGPEATRTVLLLVQFAAADTEAAWKQINEVAAEWKGKLPAGVRVETGMFRPSDLTASLRLPVGTTEEGKARLARLAAEAAIGVSTLDNVAWFAPVAGDEIQLLPLSITSAKGNDTSSALRAALGKIPGVAVRVGRPRWPLTPWPGEGQDLAVRVSGADSVAVWRGADGLRQRLAAVAGVVDCDAGTRSKPKLDLVIDRGKLKGLGISLQNLRDSIEAAGPGTAVTDLKGDGPRILIRFRDGDALRSADDLKSLRLRTAQGQFVPLSDVAELRMAEARLNYRENMLPCVVVSANVAGRDIIAVRDEVRAIAKELSRDGVSVEVE